jgi:AcrR family transcriptional regulator
VRIIAGGMGGEPTVRRAERKRAEQAAEMRGEIVEAAFAEFAARGYHQTSVADIAARVGVSAGTFYNYYKNKRDILDHVVNATVKELMGVLTDDNAPDAPTTLDEYRAQALRIAFGVDRIIDADPRIARLLLFESTSIDPELTDRVLGLFDLMGELAQGYLENGVERGFLRADLDTAGTANALTGLAMSATIRSLRSQLTRDERRKLFEAHVRLLMDGLRAD